MDSMCQYVGSLQNPVTWCGINYAGTQTTQQEYISKQRNSYQSSPTFLCFESPTASFVSQGNLFRTMWPYPAKGVWTTNKQTTKLCSFFNKLQRNQCKLNDLRPHKDCLAYKLNCTYFSPQFWTICMENVVQWSIMSRLLWFTSSVFEWRSCQGWYFLLFGASLLSPFPGLVRLLKSCLTPIVGRSRILASTEILATGMASTEILATGMKIFLYEHSNLVSLDKISLTK